MRGPPAVSGRVQSPGAGVEAQRLPDVPVLPARVHRGSQVHAGRQHPGHPAEAPGGRPGGQEQRGAVQRPLQVHLQVRPRRELGPEDTARRHGHRTLEARLHHTGAAFAGEVAQLPGVAPRQGHTQGHLEHVFEFRREHRRRPGGLRRRRGLAEPVRRLRGVRERPDEPERRRRQGWSRQGTRLVTLPSFFFRIGATAKVQMSNFYFCFF